VESVKAAVSREFSRVRPSLAGSIREPLLDQEGLGSYQKELFCRYLSPLPESNRGPPPYHGGFDLLLCHVGTALASALSLHLGWFVCSLHPSLEGP
jgi:hypothetical protein